MTKKMANAPVPDKISNGIHIPYSNRKLKFCNFHTNINGVNHGILDDYAAKYEDLERVNNNTHMLYKFMIKMADELKRLGGDMSQQIEELN